jgi:hypothetical protein
MPFTHFALFITFIDHQFKKVLKQNFILFLLDHALHIQITWLKKIKLTQQLKGEKYEHPW